MKRNRNNHKKRKGGDGKMKNKKEKEIKNGWREFFKPTWWKIILTSVAVIISYFYLGPREIITLGLETTIYKSSPMGIENIYVFFVISILFIYILFSLIELIVKKVKKC
ncbi:hypothetical protein GOV12_04915 [Candidatus Pacearchaeota archaeon]|nr:hypothetical protein [Candidatus Pacearchaeota archaeon]